MSSSEQRGLKSHGALSPAFKQLWEGRLPAPSIVSFHKWFQENSLLGCYHHTSLGKKWRYQRSSSTHHKHLQQLPRGFYCHLRTLDHKGGAFFAWTCASTSHVLYLHFQIKNHFLHNTFKAAVCPLQNKQDSWGWAGSPFPEARLSWGNCISYGFQHTGEGTQEPSLLWSDVSVGGKKTVKTPRQ